MNVIEKQTELGKSLYAINTSTMKEYMSLQRSNIENYIEVSREFGSRLPEVKKRHERSWTSAWIQRNGLEPS